MRPSQLAGALASLGHVEPMTLDHVRRDAVARSLFPPLTLPRALDRLGFVQADPIRSPARAQDLILRHRVLGYRAGDLDRQYGKLEIEEDVLINYGFLPARVHVLMLPRPGLTGWSRAEKKRADAILAFVRERGVAHPRDVDRRFAHGTTTNYWGGSSKSTTWLLEHMHYGGLLRVVGRDAGIRLYAAREPQPLAIDPVTRDAQIDALVDVAVRQYAPIMGMSLAPLVGRLRYGVPQWRRALKSALTRAKHRLARKHVDGVAWYWPADDALRAEPAPALVRLLAPFDPVVWDRRRFHRLWGWAYRFEAYTPAAKRKLGYYALPVLWRDRVIGWANVSTKNGAVRAQIGYVDGTKPRDRGFARALDDEVERLRLFLGLK